MATKTIGIILNGATGRICSTQHLQNALVPIRNEGGLAIGDDRIMPRLLLVGRDAERVAAVAKRHGIAEWSTDLDHVLGDRDLTVFFDAAATHQRAAVLDKAIAAGKHIYAEKPVAASVAQGLSLLQRTQERGLKHGAVEDKIYLPGLQKLLALATGGFFGRVVNFRLEFGWWVFDGTEVPCQRPSWNYRRAGGGGLIFDMVPHWRYIVEDVLGPIARIVTTSWTATPERIDESGERYGVDVEDSCAILVELAHGARGTILSSWATRVRRDDLLTFQVDGTHGSAIAGLHRCWTQTNVDTPRVAHFSVNVDLGIDYRDGWSEVAAAGPYKNPYRVGWEQYLHHVVGGAPLRSTLAAGLRDVQLAEACRRSHEEERWVTLDAPW
jgi:predicted dehydrogenase